MAKVKETYSGPHSNDLTCADEVIQIFLCSGKSCPGRCVHRAQDWGPFSAALGAHLQGEAAHSQSAHPQSTLLGEQQRCNKLPQNQGAMGRIK